MRINGRHRTKIHGAWAPDRNEEYLFYQTLIGAWPAEAASAPIPAAAPPDLLDRLAAYMQKAIREARVHTSWIHENAEYEQAVSNFVRRTLTGRTAARFLASFAPFQRRVAQAGMVNSLAQLVLKLASPGVPDFYQGTELWDLSLVDPDNRRAVDFAERRALLHGLRPVLDQLEAGTAVGREIRGLLDRWIDGRIKLFVTACGLRFRREHPGLLLAGAYHPLESDGPAANHLVAFARRDGSGTLLAIVPRLLTSLAGGSGSPPNGPADWASTRILLPEWAEAATYRHVLTGVTVETTDRHLPAATVFATSPVALLWAPSAHPSAAS
jgi:(1->4)-alpha-D-glucan 1-alpha-D-glucosylmutase